MFMCTVGSLSQLWLCFAHCTLRCFGVFFFDVLLHQHFHVIYLTRMDSLTSVLDVDVFKDITGECTQVRLTERYGCANV